MKKFLLLIVSVLVMTSCGVSYLVGTTPRDITDINGKVECVVDCDRYELRVDKNITKNQAPTQTKLWLYTFEEEYYWIVERSEYETKNSFFPQKIHIKVDNTNSKELDRGGKLFAYYGDDIVTGERYNIVEIPWEKGYGKFYFVGNKDRQIVYSVPINDIQWK